MNVKKLARLALFPHPAVTALLAVGAFALLIYASLALWPTHPVSIASYALSFYALVLLCLRIPDMVRGLRRFRRENAYYLRYAQDAQLRMRISLDGALAVNAVYAVFQLCLGLYHRSVWFYAMAGYYFLLAGMRLMLVRYVDRWKPGEDRMAEWRRYGICGGCLLAMNAALLIFVLYFVWQIRVFYHHEITTITMAAYTFASLAAAAIGVNRYRRLNSPVYLAAKYISFASAVVSVLTLENAMFTAFGQETDELLRRVMLGATGGVVFLFVQGMALYMMSRARKNIRILKREKSVHGE